MTLELAACRADDRIRIDPAVILAPMAGITDLAFRQVVSRFGVGLVVSEMIASGEFLTGRPGAREKAALGLDGTGPGALTSVQIAGRDEGAMAEAARRVVGMGARIVDINMGCPAKRVTGGWSGSALMRNLDHATRLVDAVVGAVDVPVTLKCRLGWDGACLNAADLAVRAEAAGVAMVTIHGRTRAQFYKGNADWAAIRAVVDAVQIPVVANGDIVDAGSARAALVASGASAVMVGRGALGAPWRLAEIAAALHGTPAPTVPRGADLAALVAGHLDASLAHYGRDLGLRVFRKHLGWYMDTAATAAPLRRAVLTAPDAVSVLRLLPDAFAEGHATESAAA